MPESAAVKIMADCPDASQKHFALHKGSRQPRQSRTHFKPTANKVLTGHKNLRPSRKKGIIRPQSRE